MGWLAEPVPVREPSTVKGSPKGTGLGTPTICSESGTLGVVKERSLPLVVPVALVATTR